MPGLPPQRKRFLRTATALAALGALAVAGCNKDSGDLNRGQQLFTARCGTCHTLAAAGTAGVQGPNLDDAFAAARARGMDADTIAGVVKAQVESPRPSVPNDPSVSMPSELASGQNLNDIAAYVGSVAGTGQSCRIQTPEQYFVSTCGTCHTLAAAGRQAQLGRTRPEPGRQEHGLHQRFDYRSQQGDRQWLRAGHHAADVRPVDQPPDALKVARRLPRQEHATRASTLTAPGRPRRRGRRPRGSPARAPRLAPSRPRRARASASGRADGSR